jgi:hypothetical protein
MLIVAFSDLGLRGTGAHGITLEEAAFINPAMFFGTIVPLMGMDNTVVIGISSPDDEFNYFSKLLELKRPDQKTPLFLTIQITQACEACQKERKLCRHNEALLPPWRTAERQAMIAQIMKADPLLFEREMLGLVRSSDSMFVFDPKLIDEFNLAPRHHFSQPPSIVWVAIDPSGGGALSNYAILSMTFQKGKSIVSFTHTTTPRSHV